MFGCICCLFFFLMIRRPPRSTQSRSSAASDVYKRQPVAQFGHEGVPVGVARLVLHGNEQTGAVGPEARRLSLIHISEPTRPY